MSDSDTEDDFVMYGTPLEPIEEDDPKRKKPTPLEEQIVTDEHGRRRFHGAFTGGFSAGFYNTVGSRDGWSPATFTSSRSKRADVSKQNRLEQFMDSEDVGDFGFAPKGVTATDLFQSRAEQGKAAANKRKKTEGLFDVIPGGSVLEDMITPVRDSKGMILLKKMGWKPGQGVGPRVRPEDKAPSSTDAEEDEESRVKMYGCFIPEEFRKRREEDEDLLAGELTFAPDDVPPWTLQPKSDLFGLGYSGLTRGNILGAGLQQRGPHLIMTEKGNRRVAISGQAFGVGAFEEEDEDIYSTEDMTQYDFELKSEAEIAKHKEGKSRFGDGSGKDPYKKFEGDVFPGFVLSRSTVTPTLFLPPPIPDSYKPCYRKYPACKGMKEPGSSRWDVTPAERRAETDAKPGLGRHTLTISQRGEALGEKPPPAVKAPPAVKVEPVDEVTTSKIEEQAVALVQEESVSLTAGFRPKLRPFARDEAKQRRYEQYLVLRRNKRTDQLSALQPPDMSDWDRAQEQAAFERAATVYEPLNSGISSRFVSSGALESTAEPEISPDMKAARLKMYGKLTRVVVDWCPGDLLCRRFNVKNPHPSVKEAQELTEQRPQAEKPSLFGFLLDGGRPEGFNAAGAPSSAGNVPKEQDDDVEKTRREDRVQSVSEVKIEPIEALGDEEKEEGKISPAGDTVEKRPPMDLFRAIFDESSDDDGEEAVNAGASSAAATLNGLPSNEAKKPSDPAVEKPRPDGTCCEPSSSGSDRKPRGQERSPETGPLPANEETDASVQKQSGLFANLDLKELEEKWKARTKALFESTKAKEAKSGPAPAAAPEPAVEVYGPALPPAPLVIVDKDPAGAEEVTLSSDEVTSSSDDDSEADGRRKSKKDKKSKRSRKESKKRKGKKKKRKKHKHKSGGSSD